MTLNKNHAQNDIDQAADMTEKERIAGVMASMMDDQIARYLGSFSDSGLRDFTARMFDFMEEYGEVLTDEQNIKKDSAAQRPRTGGRVGELRRDRGKKGWIVCDAHTGEQIATLRQGMRLDVCEDEDGGEWVSAAVRASVCKMWYFVKDADGVSWFDNSLPPFDDGLRVRLR